MQIEYNKSIDYIIEKISAIKKNCNKNLVYSNYYFQKFNGYSEILIFDINSIVFFIKDIDFYRLFFYSKDLKELTSLINRNEDLPILIDYLAKELPYELKNIFLESGYILYAEMLHMRNNKISHYELNDLVTFASEEDLEDIYNNLFIWLDKYTGHFPIKSELLNMICNKQVIVAKKEGKVIGFFISKIQGKNGELYQWCFTKDKNDYNADLAISIYFYALGIMKQKGVENSFLWVNSTNKNVIKVHSLNGFKFDGLKDFVFLKK